VREEEKHCRDGSRDDPQGQVVKREEEKQKQERECSERDEKKQSARDAFGAQREPLVAVGAGLIGNLKQVLVRAPLTFVLRLGFDHGIDDSGEHFVAAFCALAS